MDGGSQEPRAYIRLGPAGAPTPLVIAVPHAGRYYPDGLLVATRLSRAALETIEDRHADLLIADAVAAGAVAIVARHARALVDLNRDPREVDPASVRRLPDDAGAWLQTEKVAGGLGIVPSRIAAGGAVWKRPLDQTDIARRIETVHRPYHQAIEQALDAAIARHGVAILLDCHSMPPLGPPNAPGVVIGDRHGASASAAYGDAALAACQGLSVARNRPYAGGFTLDRHGSPSRGRHAIQIEIDRTLYLADDMRTPGPGLASAQALIARIARAITRVAGDGIAMAAE